MEKNSKKHLDYNKYLDEIKYIHYANIELLSLKGEDS